MRKKQMTGFQTIQISLELMWKENLTYVWTSNFHVSEKDGIRGDKKTVKENGIVSEYFTELHWFD